jgi:hypothetical protein
MAEIQDPWDLYAQQQSYGYVEPEGDTDYIVDGRTGQEYNAPKGVGRLLLDIENDDLFDVPATISEEAAAVFENQASGLALVANAFGVISDDETADIVSQRSKALANVQKRQPEYMKKWNKEWAQAKGFFEHGAVIMDNIPAIGREGIVSVVNSSIPMLTSYIGLKAGAAAGAAVGSVVPGVGTAAGGVLGGIALASAGRFTGTTVVETGAAMDQLLVEAGVDKTNTAQVLEALSDDKFVNEIKIKAMKKGLTTASVETLFQFWAGRFLKIPAATTKAKKIAAGAVDVSVQAVGEGAGELAGSYAAYDKLDVKGAIREAITSIGSSAAYTGIGAAARTSGKTIKSIKQDQKETKPQTDLEKSVAKAQTELESMIGLSNQEDIPEAISEQLGVLIKEKEQEVQELVSQVEQEKSVIEAQQGKGKVKVPKEPPSLSNFLKDKGGLDEGSGDASLFTKEKAPDLKGVASKKGTLSLERALEAAIEAGYLEEGASINDLTEALQNESLGIKKFSSEDAAQVSDREFALKYNQDIERQNEEILQVNKEFKGIKDAFLRGVRAAKRDVKTVQNEIINLIEKSALSKEDKGKFLKTIKNVQTFKQLESQFPKIQNKIFNLLNKEAFKKQKDRLKKSLSTKSIKPLSVSGKKVGKFSPLTQKRLEELSSFLNMKKDDASDLLSERVDKGVMDPIGNTILNMRANPQNVSASDIAEVNADIDSIKDLGRAQHDVRENTFEAKVKQITDSYEKLGPKQVQDKKRSAADKVKDVFKGLNNTFLSQSGAWRQKIKFILESKDKDAVNKFLEDVSLTKESGFFETGKQTQVKKFVDLAMKRAGFSNQREFLNYLQESSQEKVIDKVFRFSDGTNKQLTMTRAEARKRVMEFADTSIKTVMQLPQSNGYTQEIISEIENSLSETDYQLVQAQLDYYRDYYERINDVYKKMYGIDLPKIEFYSPIRRNFADNSVDEFLKGIMYRGGAAPGSLKSRKPNYLPFKQNGDFNVLQSHIHEMEYFIAFAEKVNVLQKAFKNASIQKKILDSYGPDILDTINKDLDWFTRKGKNEAIAGENLLRTLMRNFALSQLALKPQIGLKQLTSTFAYMTDVSTKDFISGLGDFAKNPKKALKVLESSNTFKSRGLNIDKDFQDMLSDKSLLNVMGRNPSLTNWLMLPIRLGDKGAIAIGGYSYYKALRKKGLSHEQAISKFDQKTSDTQQSTNPDQISELQRSNGFVRILVQFMSSSNALMRGEYEAILDGIKGRDKASDTAKKLLIYHFLIPNLFQSVANGFSWDEKDQLRASILGSLNGIFLWGDVMEAGVSYAVSGDYFKPDVRHPAQFFSIMLDAINAYSKEDVSLESFLDGARAIELSTAAGGALTGIPLKTLYNDLVGAKKGIEAKNSDDVIKSGALLLGYSPYIVDKKIIGKDKKNNVDDFEL